MKPIINICVVGAVLTTSSFAMGNSLNEQKSSIRNEMSITELENSLYEKKNTGLELQIRNKKLEMEKNKVFSQDSTIYLDEVNDPIFGESLTEEDKMSFGKDKGYGKEKRGGVSSSFLNARDRKAKKDAMGLEGENGKINAAALEKKIREIVASEVADKTPIVTTTPESLENSIPIQKTMEPEIIAPSDKGAVTTLVKMDVQKLVIFGEQSKASVLATFKVTKGNKSSLIENVELELEEGQIYTYFNKVYSVKAITKKRLVLTNSTDSVDIVQHL